MRILMTGPGFGHNISPFIDYFKKKPSHRVSFVYETKCDFKNSENVTFYSGRMSKLSFIFRTLPQLIKKYDVIWVHGCYNYILLLVVFLFARNKKSIVLSVWGEYIPKKLLKKSLDSRILRYIFNNVGTIQANWFGVTNILQKSVKTKILTKPWGMTNELIYFLEKEKITDEARKFIEGTDKKKYKFFFPKTINNNNAHDVIIDACEKLVDKGIRSFVVYFWLGNSVDSKLLDKFSESISKKMLKDFIKIEEHSYLPFYDMGKIWEVMDCGLQIVRNDQLSTTFLEPQLFKKELIASNIYPYQKYNEEFNVSIPLIDINSESVAKEMELLIKGVNKTADTVLEQRTDVVKENFVFEKNIKFLLKEFTK